MLMNYSRVNYIMENNRIKITNFFNGMIEMDVIQMKIVI